MTNIFCNFEYTMCDIHCSRCLDYSIWPCNELQGLSDEDWYFRRTSCSAANIIQNIVWVENITLKYITLRENWVGFNPNTFNVILDFREEIKFSHWYACGQWHLSRSWRIFEMPRCDTIRLLYRIYNASTSQIIRFGLWKTSKVYPISSCDQCYTMEIHPLYSIISFTAEQSQSQ